MKTAWTWIKNNFVTILDVSIVVIGILIFFLDLFDFVSLETVAAATLAILSLIAASLLASRTMSNQLQQAIEKVLARSQEPSASQVFAPFKEHVQEMEQRLWMARDVWILSRTGSRLWSDYQDQFMRLLSENRGVIRIMMVDPGSHAFKIITETAGGWENPNNAELWKAMHKDFLTRLAVLCAQFEQDNLQMRAVKYLPACTLILIDPWSDKGVIYVELATFRAHPRTRPTFSLTADRDTKMFQDFRTEFEAMWEYAQSVDSTTYAEGIA